MAESRVPALVVSQREYDVLAELLHDGADNHEIADRLHVSIDTVKSHLRRLYDRSGFPNRTALVLAVVTEQIDVQVQTRCGECRAKNGEHRQWCPEAA